MNLVLLWIRKNPLLTAAIGVIIALLALLAIQTARLWERDAEVAIAEAGLAKEKQGRAEDREKWEKLRADAAEAALQKQQKLQADVDSAREGLADAQARIREQDARIARLTVDSRQLRDQLGAFAAGAGGQDTLAACQARAGTLAGLAAEGAELLVEGAGLCRETAKAAAERAAEVNALLQAWPGTHAEDH